MNFSLTTDEAALLAQLIQTRLDELGPELRRTEQMEFHDRLKAQKVVLEKILHQLRGTA
ncbi:MAG: hypothetical protein K8T91_23995 [Planctomycetes bacterium]|jgi:hypothetical protein|nr:hypothetical protein [Planctomycetota bacterium]